MALSVVENNVRREGPRKSLITIKSDLGLEKIADFPRAIMELQSGDATRLAINYAATQLGMQMAAADPMKVSAYPVDAEGKEVVDGRTQKVHHYQVDVPVVVGVP